MPPERSPERPLYPGAAPTAEEQAMSNDQTDANTHSGGALTEPQVKKRSKVVKISKATMNQETAPSQPANAAIRKSQRKKNLQNQAVKDTLSPAVAQERDARQQGNGASTTNAAATNEGDADADLDDEDSAGNKTTSRRRPSKKPFGDEEESDDGEQPVVKKPTTKSNSKTINTRTNDDGDVDAGNQLGGKTRATKAGPRKEPANIETTNTAETATKKTTKNSSKARTKRKASKIYHNDNASIPSESSDDGGKVTTKILKAKIDRHARWCPWIRINKKLRYVNRHNKQRHVESSDDDGSDDEAGDLIDLGDDDEEEEDEEDVSQPAPKKPGRKAASGKANTKGKANSATANKGKKAASGSKKGGKAAGDVAEDDGVDQADPTKTRPSNTLAKPPLFTNRPQFPNIKEWGESTQLTQQTTRAASDSRIDADDIGEEPANDNNASSDEDQSEGERNDDSDRPADGPTDAYLQLRTNNVDDTAFLSDRADTPPTDQKAHADNFARPRAPSSATGTRRQKRKAREDEAGALEGEPAVKKRGRPSNASRKSAANIAQDDVDF